MVVDEDAFGDGRGALGEQHRGDEDQAGEHGVSLPRTARPAGKKSVDAPSYVGRMMPSMPSRLALWPWPPLALLLPAAPLAAQPATRIPVIVDTDANNELDDQHALAYVLLNGDTFDVEGVTVNATRGGGDIRGRTRRPAA